MSYSLANALHGIPLDVGETYRCEVDGRLVEVRVLGHTSDTGTAATRMLNPWTEFPLPTAQFRLRVKTGRLPAPDLLDIPVNPDDVG